MTTFHHKYPERESPLASFVGWATVLIFVFTVFGGGWVTQSYFEARAFERATGKRVSTWDAMFIELRVQESPK